MKSRSRIEKLEAQQAPGSAGHDGADYDVVIRWLPDDRIISEYYRTVDGVRTRCTKSDVPAGHFDSAPVAVSWGDGTE